MNNQKSELTEIVGSSNVFDDPAILEGYSKDSIFAKPVKPGLVVKVSHINAE